MIRGVFTFFTFISAVLFPWTFTAILAIAAASVEPLIPLAAGICADMFYYAPGAHFLPVFTFYGAALTIFAFVVRSRLRTGPVR